MDFLEGCQNRLGTVETGCKRTLIKLQQLTATYHISICFFVKIIVLFMNRSTANRNETIDCIIQSVSI